VGRLGSLDHQPATGSLGDPSLAIGVAYAVAPRSTNGRDSLRDMPLFMDRHDIPGVTPEQVAEAQRRRPGRGS